MSKTPAWRLIQSLRDAIHLAAAGGEPVAELLDERRAADALRERRLTRRAALGAGAATMASAITSCAGTTATQPPVQPRQAKSKSAPVVAVVGAGLAGLRCAARLVQAGLQVGVHDAATRIGGRVLSDRKTFHPQICELGAELIDSEHVMMRELARELDIKLVDFGTDLPELHEMVAHLGGASLTMRDLVAEFTPVAARIDAEKASLRDPKGDISYRSTNGGERLDRMSIAEWLDREKISGRIRRFLEVAYILEFGLETSDSSALNLVTLLAGSSDRIAKKPGAWGVWGESDMRYHAAEGNDQFVHRLADRIGRERIHLAQRLVRVSSLSDGRLSLAFTGDGGTVETAVDRVVLAIPFTLLREVDLSRVRLSPVKRRTIAELGMGLNTKLMCGFSERVWRARHKAAGMTLTDLPFQCAWDTSRMQTGERGIMTQYYGGKSTEALRRTTPEQHRRDFVDQLERVYPGVKATALETTVRFDWPSDPLVFGSYSGYRVGQWTTLGGCAAEAEGPLHFCGEHTGAQFQGYMEGAVESGTRAAAEVIAALAVRGGEREHASQR